MGRKDLAVGKQKTRQEFSSLPENVAQKTLTSQVELAIICLVRDFTLCERAPAYDKTQLSAAKPSLGLCSGCHYHNNPEAICWQVDEGLSDRVRQDLRAFCRAFAYLLDMIFSLEDLADQVGEKPSRAAVEEFVPQDKNQLDLLISADPGKKHGLLWGYLSSLVAESCVAPLMLPSRDYAGVELSHGNIILQEAGAHVGERMKGGRIQIEGSAGDYLGQEMSGGGIIAASCRGIMPSEICAAAMAWCGAMQASSRAWATQEDA